MRDQTRVYKHGYSIYIKFETNAKRNNVPFSDTHIVLKFVKSKKIIEHKIQNVAISGGKKRNTCSTSDISSDLLLKTCAEHRYFSL